ncbi:MAG: ribose-5-phosphate isomerase RpiA [Acidobacteria bacterium]|nr:ribose-5-phosphate isomerase RpiA [Acidobacteriota bacterium]
MAARKTKEQLAEEKEAAAQVALKFVRSGMRLGLGSGSTADCFIRLLGDQVRHGALRVSAIATSKVSERRAVECGIPLIRPVRGLTLDLGIDGADEISPDLELIKGGGGALLREKVVERACRYFVVIADSSKLVERLGAFPLPVEVIPFSLPWVLDELEALGAKPMQRMIPGDLGQPYCTDQENYIVDCHFGVIEDARALERKLASMPGIAEHGIFIDYANAALVAHGREIIVLRPGHPASPLSAPEAACLEESIIPK